jgi:cytochrome c biogenesis protein CcmG, thiol:disulfide interchange protein DsbE
MSVSDAAGRPHASGKLGRVRKLLLATALLTVVVVVVAIGLGQAKKGDGGSTTALAPLTRAQVTRALGGASPGLAALHRRAGELVPGGTARFDRELRDLRGTPVVVNLWAAWCGPCRFEIPFLQRQYLRDGARVAFLGVNTDDSTSAARSLLRKLPLPYPSIVDQRSGLAGRLGTKGLPVTAYYTRDGKLNYVHQGSYPSLEQLAADVRRYAT